MVLPGSYQGAKRAALSFSAIVFVVAVSQSSGPVAIIGGVTGFSINLTTGMILLWLAAAYYTSVFHLEYRTAAILNSQWQRETDTSAFQQRLDSFADQLMVRHRELDTCASALNTQSSKSLDQPELAKQIYDAREALINFALEVRSQLNAARSTNRSGQRSPEWVDAHDKRVRSAVLRIRGRYADILSKFEQSVLDSQDRYTETLRSQSIAVERAAQDLAQASEAVRQIKLAVTQLSDRIVRHRVLTYRYADWFVVLALFACATCAGGLKAWHSVHGYGGSRSTPAPRASIASPSRTPGQTAHRPVVGKRSGPLIGSKMGLQR